MLQTVTKLILAMVWQQGEDHCIHDRNFQNADDEKQCIATVRISKKKPQELLVQFLPPRGEATEGACKISPDSKTAQQQTCSVDSRR